MPTFKSREVVDARQLDGTRDNLLQMALWVQSNEGRAESVTDSYTSREFRLFEHHASRIFTTGYQTDWVVQRQNGTFELMRDEDFKKRYEQV